MTDVIAIMSVVDVITTRADVIASFFLLLADVNANVWQMA